MGWQCFALLDAQVCLKSHMVDHHLLNLFSFSFLATRVSLLFETHLFHWLPVSRGPGFHAVSLELKLLKLQSEGRKSESGQLDWRGGGGLRRIVHAEGLEP